MQELYRYNWLEISYLKSNISTSFSRKFLITRSTSSSSVKIERSTRLNEREEQRGIDSRARRWFLDGFQLTLGYSTHDRVYIQFPWPIKMRRVDVCDERVSVQVHAPGKERDRGKEKEGMAIRKLRSRLNNRPREDFPLGLLPVRGYPWMLVQRGRDVISTVV